MFTASFATFTVFGVGGWSGQLVRGIHCKAEDVLTCIARDAARNVGVLGEQGCLGPFESPHRNWRISGPVLRTVQQIFIRGREHLVENHCAYAERGG